MTCSCRKGATCAEHLVESDLVLPAREVSTPAFYEERIRLLRAENQRLQEALRRIKEGFEPSFQAKSSPERDGIPSEGPSHE